MTHRPARPKVIVLDDDPTGSQTVHGCLLLTRWDERTLRAGLRDGTPLFFVLTNTRSTGAAAAAELTRRICRNLKRALRGFSDPWLVVSRSDSTLRGHYPVETDVIAQELGPFDAHFLAPQFFEGGRITRGGSHYVVRSGAEVPAHETEFARDSVFAYSTAYLPAYVEEKTGGRIRAEEVELFDPAEPDAVVRERLRALHGNACCAVSAVTQTELDRFAALAIEVSAEGKRFLFRSGASLLTSLAALPPQPVPAREMGRYVQPGRPGLVVVGSHVPTSTAQLERLLADRAALVAGTDSAGRRLEPVELEVDRLPDRDGSVRRGLSARLADAHRSGRHVALYTSRGERRFATPEERLAFGEGISRVLAEVVRSAPRTTGYILSKGGITSNEVLRTGLRLATARLVGQIHPGCSVLLTPRAHRFGSIPVVIFPGNVGDDSSLTLVYDRLAHHPDAR